MYEALYNWNKHGINIYLGNALRDGWQLLPYIWVVNTYPLPWNFSTNFESGPYLNVRDRPLWDDRDSILSIVAVVDDSPLHGDSHICGTNVSTITKNTTPLHLLGTAHFSWSLRLPGDVLGWTLSDIVSKLLHLLHLLFKGYTRGILAEGCLVSRRSLRGTWHSSGRCTAPGALVSGMTTLTACPLLTPVPVSTMALSVCHLVIILSGVWALLFWSDWFRDKNCLPADWPLSCQCASTQRPLAWSNSFADRTGHTRTVFDAGDAMYVVTTGWRKSWVYCSGALFGDTCDKSRWPAGSNGPWTEVSITTCLAGEGGGIMAFIWFMPEPSLDSYSSTTSLGSHASTITWRRMDDMLAPMSRQPTSWTAYVSVLSSPNILSCTVSNQRLSPGVYSSPAFCLWSVMRASMYRVDNWQKSCSTIECCRSPHDWTSSNLSSRYSWAQRPCILGSWYCCWWEDQGERV